MELKLQIADKTDIRYIVGMVEKFFKESPYQDFTFSANKIRLILNERLGTDDFVCILLKCNDEYVGMLIATKVELIFSNDTITSELAWWVDEEYRGTKQSLELLKAYEYWSKNVAKADACQMVSLQNLSPEKLDKLYKLKGFDHVESAYMKRWN